MAGLEFCSKHNMVAYLEKTDGNTEFHQIMDFLIRSSIYYALTVSPIVSTLFVEQFWTTAKSRTVNNTSYIDATVAGKPVTISEASIRSDLLFDDADGIDSLNNQAIFDNIQLMGYEKDLNTLTFNKALFSPQWKFLFHTMNHCISSKSTSWDQIPTNIATAVICLATNQKYNFSKLVFGGMIRHLDATKKFVMYPRFLQIFLSNQLKDVPVPLDHFPVPTLTKKVLTYMVKKGKNFSGKVIPLFDLMLVQQIEGEALERPSDSQPIPSPPHPNEDQPQTQTAPFPRPSPSIYVPDPEGSGGNHGGQSSNDESLSGNEDGLTLQSVKKLKKGVKPLITHHKAWMKTRLARKTSLKKNGVHKEYVPKQGRKSIKSFKGEPSMHKDLAFDDLDDIVDDTLDYMETVDAQDERRISSVVLEDKENADKEVSTEAPVSTVKPNEGTNKKNVSTVKPNEGADKKNKGTDKQDGGTDSTKVSTDRQGEGTIDQNEGKSATQTAPTTTSTPTLTIFGDDETIAQVLITMSQNKQKEKEKRKGITEAEKKFKQLANDEEVARKVQEEWEAEEEKKRLAEEEATKAAPTNEYDFIQARINADKILAKELQKEEREKFTIKQRAKFLHDTIHVGGKKHSELKTKTFEEIQVLYERLKRQDQNIVAIRSAEDERQIKELNKDPEKKRLKKRVVNETPREEDTTRVHVKQEVTEQGIKKRKSGHVKMIARKRPRPQPDDDSDDEHKKCLRIVTFKGTIDSEIMETKSFISRLHKVSSPDRNYLVVYRVNGHFRAFNYLMEVLHIFYRQDLFHLYDLVMKQYSEITPEDIELILWGDLKIMIESPTEENKQGDFWNNQQEWEIVRWRLYEACGVCILELKDGIVIYMLIERRYPLSKELLQQMIDLGLEVEEESTAALQLGSQLTLLHSKELASPRSNSSWLSIHLVVYNEELAIPEQTATGKGISNPLMASSLPKTIKPT
ncbi:hypothetical protein Tco_0097380 [Tanacetum coccineum]